MAASTANLPGPPAQRLLDKGERFGNLLSIPSTSVVRFLRQPALAPHAVRGVLVGRLDDPCSWNSGTPEAGHWTTAAAKASWAASSAASKIAHHKDFWSPAVDFAESRSIHLWRLT